MAWSARTALAVKRAPEQIETGTIIAASDAVLADYVGALKMGLDPAVSPIFERVARDPSLAAALYDIGLTDALCRLEQRPGTRVTDDADAFQQPEPLDRLVEPWLQRLGSGVVSVETSAGCADECDACGVLRRQRLAVGDWPTRCSASSGRRSRPIERCSTRMRCGSNRCRLGLIRLRWTDDAFEALVDELTALEPIALAAPRCRTSCAGDMSRKPSCSATRGICRSTSSCSWATGRCGADDPVHE